ncbi:hypothetical protein [Burkholderia sp. LMG 13014]|uniref:hypothetical protein n=1 Tax=Burkholderia sp. LMG 13014 TaxID=2709306 RepID=UPI0019641310|nr:hypothetical protein [Burkholderia sp. LMG 13014]
MKKEGQQTRIEEARQHAALLGGSCLSNEYTGFYDPLIWKCKIQEHEPWKARFYSVVKYGQWCMRCTREAKLPRPRNPEGLKKAQSHAKSKGGDCLSTEYKNARTSMTWKCANDSHPAWDASYNRVVSGGHWCPECGKNNLCEQAIRRVFEVTFKKPFASARPAWLANPETNRRLELDGYNEELKLAFEHNGPHHFIHDQHFFNENKDRYEVQARRDAFKHKACEENAVALVSIPWNRNYHKKNKEGRRDFLDHLYICCMESGVIIPALNKADLRMILNDLRK